MEAEVILPQEYERELLPADQPQLHLRGMVNVFTNHHWSLSTNILFQKSWAPVHLLPPRAPSGGGRNRAGGKTATRGPGGSWGTRGGGTSSDERSVMVSLSWVWVKHFLSKAWLLKNSKVSKVTSILTEIKSSSQTTLLAAPTRTQVGGLEALFRA